MGELQLKKHKIMLKINREFEENICILYNFRRFAWKLHILTLYLQNIILFNGKRNEEQRRYNRKEKGRKAPFYIRKRIIYLECTEKIFDYISA